MLWTHNPESIDTTFPLPFKSLRTMAGCKEGAYIVGAMFTSAYSEKAKRLAASCEKFQLPYVIHEVPTIHRSINTLGSDDLTYTKPNFIRNLLATHKKPLVYLDVDCEFVARPALIEQLAESECDFAIHNRFGGDETPFTFVNIELSPRPGEPPIANRFYRFMGTFGWRSQNQLMCLGMTQFYRNTLAARAFLSRWQRTIIAFPGSADDACLEFTFNNMSRLSWLSWLLKAHWLPASYARLPYWIFTEPVINHPDIPGKYSPFVAIKDPNGRKQIYRSSVRKRRHSTTSFFHGCIIDTDRKMLCQLVEGRLVPLGPIDQKFWL